VSFQVNETNSKVTVDETVTTLVVEDKAARVTITGDGTTVEITAPGPQGAKGETGAGVPVGGATNDILVKDSATDYDTSWTDAITVDKLSFDTTAAETAGGGQMVWDAADGTVHLGFNGGTVVLPIGQKQIVKVFNEEFFQINAGQPVRITGAQGQRVSVKLASAADAVSASHAIGLATTNISQRANGFVTIQGLVRGLSTAGFVEGDQLFVGTTAGTLTKVRPPAPNHAVQIGFVTVASPGQSANGSIYVNVLVGDHLEYLHDVTISNLTTGQVLYNSTSGVWVNKALSASDVSGVVPTTRQVASGTGLAGGGNLSADRTLSVLYGTTAGTAAQGDDARLSDARTPLAHATTHHTGGSDPLTATNIGAAQATTQMIAGTGLSGGGTLEANRTFTVLYGTTAGTAAQGNDARLSDARTPTAHASTHFTGGSDPINATNIGAVPEGRQVISGTGLAGGGDLSADRTLSVLYGTTSGTAAQGNDARLSDARTPTAHASTHFTGGSDALTATNIGAAQATRQIIAGTGLSGGGTLEADRTLTVLYGTTTGTAASGDRGLITGGTTGQVLRKTSGTDYAVEWGSVWEDDQVILAGQVFG
jgi:hypothetical protein